MEKLIECVMNVSEGRDRQKLETIASQIDDVSNAFLLDCAVDAAHNRAVLSFIGTPESVLGAAFAAVQVAVRLIDLRIHRGVHPRIGAVDVVPFTPLRGVSMAECVDVAARLGQRIATRLGVPVYLYGEAARIRNRRDLSRVREGEFERLEELIRVDPARSPDFGEDRLHPTAGAAAVGARGLLIAYNVYLKTADVTLSQKVAARIRGAGSGLESVRALGFYIDHKGLAQVSMNVTDYQKASLSEVLQRVQQEALLLQTDVHSSEIVGLVPRCALVSGSPEFLKLEGFHSGQILEYRIEQVLKSACTD